MNTKFETRKTNTCDYCGKPAFRRFPLNIALDSIDETDPDADMQREWSYGLCEDCFQKWYDGRISTETLVNVCNLRIELGTIKREFSQTNQ